MLKQSDVEGRLKLFRFGLLVVVLVTFAVGVGTQYLLGSMAGNIAMGSVMISAGIQTAVVAVIMVVVYFAYAAILKNTVGKGGDSE